jgi:hypothetical protein
LPTLPHQQKAAVTKVLEPQMAVQLKINKKKTPLFGEFFFYIQYRLIFAGI